MKEKIFSGFQKYSIIASIHTWEWLLVHLFSYCIFKLALSVLEIGMVAWTSQCHSCGLIFSEWHVTAGDSSAVWTQPVYVLCIAWGRTISAACLQKAGPVQDTLSWSWREMDCLGEEEVWKSVLKESIVQKKKKEEGDEGWHGNRGKKGMILNHENDKYKKMKRMKNRGNSVRVVMFCSVRVSMCACTHLCFCDCYQDCSIFQSSSDELSPWSFLPSTFGSLPESLQLWRKKLFGA